MEQEVKLTKLAKCAGCGAKVGAGVLAKLLEGIKVREDPNLLVGFDRSDDASVYRVSDELALVQTLDFFPPIADDPYTFGQIAATNALSDVYAMGGEPKLALNILCIPADMPKETVHALLRGGYDKVYEAGALITGGHSILDEEPKYGLSVTGFVHPDRVLTNSGAHEGDVLFADQAARHRHFVHGAEGGHAQRRGRSAGQELMTTLNRAARDCMVQFRVHACTDVTGFGLMGHLLEMAQGSDLTAVIDTSAIDIIPEALSLARIGLCRRGCIATAPLPKNTWDAGDVEVAVQDVLFDPQTAGGLLMAVDPADADALYAMLKENVPSAQRIGTLKRAEGKRIILR